MKFGFRWIHQLAETDSQARALAYYFECMDLECNINLAGIRGLRDIILAESDQPYFWLNILESLWRVYVFRTEGHQKASYSPNFKRSQSKCIKRRPTKNRPKNRK